MNYALLVTKGYGIQYLIGAITATGTNLHSMHAT